AGRLSPEPLAAVAEARRNPFRRKTLLADLSVGKGRGQVADDRIDGRAGQLLPAALRPFEQPDQAAQHGVEVEAGKARLEPVGLVLALLVVRAAQERAADQARGAAVQKLLLRAREGAWRVEQDGFQAGERADDRAARAFARRRVRVGGVV